MYIGKNCGIGTKISTSGNGPCSLIPPYQRRRSVETPAPKMLLKPFKIKAPLLTTEGNELRHGAMSDSQTDKSYADRKESTAKAVSGSATKDLTERDTALSNIVTSSTKSMAHTAMKPKQAPDNQTLKNSSINGTIEIENKSMKAKTIAGEPLYMTKVERLTTKSKSKSLAVTMSSAVTLHAGSTKIPLKDKDKDKCYNSSLRAIGPVIFHELYETGTKYCGT